MTSCAPFCLISNYEQLFVHSVCLGCSQCNILTRHAYMITETDQREKNRMRGIETKSKLFFLALRKADIQNIRTKRKKKAEMVIQEFVFLIKSRSVSKDANQSNATQIVSWRETEYHCEMRSDINCVNITVPPYFKHDLLYHLHPWQH